MNYFMMSHRFDKTSLQDFGLVLTDGKIVSSDGIEWIPRGLYDFGWGPENGYCRYPIPDFPFLISLASQNVQSDDVFGAASVILEDYPSDLLAHLESIMKTGCDRKTRKHLCFLFKLDIPLNRTVKPEMPLEETKTEHSRWKKVTEYFNQKP